MGVCWRRLVTSKTMTGCALPAMLPLMLRGGVTDVAVRTTPPPEGCGDRQEEDMGETGTTGREGPRGGSPPEEAGLTPPLLTLAPTDPALRALEPPTNEALTMAPFMLEPSVLEPFMMEPFMTEPAVNGRGFAAFPLESSKTCKTIPGWCGAV